MKKTQEEILEEMRGQISQMRAALDAMERKLEDFVICAAEPEVATTEPVVAEVVKDAVEVAEVVTDADAVEVATAEPVDAEIVADAEVATAEPVDAEPEPVATALNELHSSTLRMSVGDAMADRESWRNGIPGTPVDDVMKAFSLNDRLLFTRELFGGDNEKFSEIVSKINGAKGLETVVGMIRKHFPDWKMDSDTVSRFMMAVRRKVDL